MSTTPELVAQFNEAASLMHLASNVSSAAAGLAIQNKADVIIACKALELAQEKQA